MTEPTYTTSTASTSFQEGVDYYIENGFYVFTAHFLRKRGYCCGNGCRHCPYKAQQPSPARIDDCKSSMSGN